MKARPNSSILFALMLLTACQPASEGRASRISDYERARGIFWAELYPGSVTSLYCDEAFESDERRGFNVEHVFPMSWVTNALDCGKRKQCRANSATFNLIEADLHNLYPARSDVNADRASFKFGEVGGEARRYGQRCDFEVDRRARTVEPRPAVRGEVARAMFYMAWQYRDQGLKIFARSGKILQQWHNEDPPTEVEQVRNQRISVLQGNSNVFVDDPEQLNALIAQGFFY